MSVTSNHQLRTKESDKPFHSARRMFWIINSKPIIAPSGTELSHIEFAEKQGWCSPQTSLSFAENHVRGFFLSQNETPVLHFYRGEFQFDEAVEQVAKQAVPELLKLMPMPQATKVFVGPKDNFINGRQYTVKCIGTIEDFV